MNYRELRSKSDKKPGRLWAGTIAASILAADFLVRDSLVVRQRDTLTKKALRAFPSAFAVPGMTGNKTADTLFAMTTVGISVEVARRTSSAKELAVTSVGAHALACTVNTLLERTGQLSDEERDAEDVGSSAVALALAVKYGTDRLATAETTKARLGWSLGLTALVGATVVAPYISRDTHRTGTMDAAAHLSGAFTGVVSSLATRS